MEPKTPSNRSTSPLGEEEKKIYAEFTSAETYVSVSDFLFQWVKQLLILIMRGVRVRKANYN